jgi:hypothetical protein
MTMSSTATVLIPTHNHGPLLEMATRSALAQTISNIEVFIVLDGADEPTREVAEAMRRADTRVRVFTYAKGERHGEAHRHMALQEARGQFICYLSDDDLWFPDHVEYLQTLLEQADFVHSVPLVGMEDGTLGAPYVGDLRDPRYRQAMLDGFNFVPLSAGGHTIEAYRSLPIGWSPAPADLHTDLHMWQKFLAAGTTSMTGGRPTVLQLPSVARPSMPLEERVEEMEHWSRRIGDPAERSRLRAEAYEALAAAAARMFMERREFESTFVELHRRIEVADEQNRPRDEAYEELVATADRLSTERQELEATVAGLNHRIDLESARAASLMSELAAIYDSTAYRGARRLADLPLIGPIGRWVGRALTRRGDR